MTTDATQTTAAPALLVPGTEYEQRFARVRERMAEQDLDLFLTHVPENLYYLTGYRTPGYYAYQCLAVPADGDPLLVVRLLETTNAAALSYVRDYVGYDDSSDPLEVVVGALRERGLLAGRVGLEGDAWFLAPKAHARLVDAIGVDRVVDASGTVEQVRLRKSPAEIDFIREAAVAAEAGMTRALATIRPGITENEVAAAMFAGAIEAGSEYMSLPPFVASGPRSGLAHATWEGRRILAGDPVFLEVSGVSKRYSAGLMRTGVAGEADAEQRRISAAVVAGLEAAIEAMVPGATSDAVNTACREPIESAGLGRHFLHRTGYSIGANFPPDWGEGHIASLRAGDGLVLEPGMVFHVVPAVVVQSALGIGCSATVVITENGPEPLGSLERRLFECPL